MTSAGAGTVGKTKDAGWQIGVSKTLPYPVGAVWSQIVGTPALWLGAGSAIPRDKGEQWQADDGTAGELRSRRECDRVRLTWRPPTWSHDTTVQVAVQATATGTVLRFHQERLAGPGERRRQRSHWQAALARIEGALQAAEGTA